MAILLVGMMLTPLGICLQRGSTGQHGCCMHAESAHTVQSNCCIVRTQLQATLPAPSLPSASPAEATDQFVGYGNAQALGTHIALHVIPPLSPPTGAFILRI
jgi:hypothetical protein